MNGNGRAHQRALRILEEIMPRLTRWYLKLSLLYLIGAIGLRLMLSANRPLGLSIPTGAFEAISYHLFMVGWVTQLIFGVVYWMFPKVSKDKPRGDERIAWFVFWSLNLGLVLRLVGEPALSINPSLVWGWMLASSAILQFLAGLGFVFVTWGRVKER
jgi:heme/copper-type cytochrome/quinol oxidase subunit 1